MLRLLGAAGCIALAACNAVRAETLTIETHYTDAQRAPLTACFREYEAAHPGISIAHRQVDIDDYLQSVLTARIGGTAPDIYNVYSIWSAQLTDAGILDAPPDDVARRVQADFLPGTVDAIRVGGRIWGIPGEISTYQLIYNKTLFAAAGIAGPPRDWGEVLADAARITRRNATGKITTMGFAFGPSPANGVYPFYALLQSKGVLPFKPDLSGTNLTAPEAVDVLTGMRQLFEQGSTDNTMQVRDFPSGAIGMMIHANWYKQTLREAFGARMDDVVGVAPIPAGPDWRTLQYAFFWGVDGGSRHKREAWDLLSWLNSPRDGARSCMGAFLDALGALTGNRADLAGSPDYSDAFSKPFADAIASGRAVAAPNVLHGSEILQTLRLSLGRAWTGEQTPAAALQEADAHVTEMLKDR